MISYVVFESLTPYYEFLQCDAFPLQKQTTKNIALLLQIMYLCLHTKKNETVKTSTYYCLNLKTKMIRTATLVPFYHRNNFIQLQFNNAIKSTILMPIGKLHLTRTKRKNVSMSTIRLFRIKCIQFKWDKENLNKTKVDPYENISAELIHITDTELNERSLLVQFSLFSVWI